jgi:hypothetical protein
LSTINSHRSAGIDLARNLHSEESTSDLPSSRYDRSKLLALKLSPADGMAELLIEITSRAGTKVGLQLPVNVKL